MEESSVLLKIQELQNELAETPNLRGYLNYQRQDLEATLKFQELKNILVGILSGVITTVGKELDDSWSPYQQFQTKHA